MSRKEKRQQKQKLATRQLINTKSITDHSLLTYGHGELVYFIIKPTNISVLSEASIAARIYALMTVLKGLAEIEMCCLNSRENFEDNKRFLKSRIEREDNPAIRRLLEDDLVFLDRIQVQMATAREFLLIIRLRDEKESEVPLPEPHRKSPAGAELLRQTGRQGGHQAAAGGVFRAERDHGAVRGLRRGTLDYFRRLKSSPFFQKLWYNDYIQDRW